MPLFYFHIFDGRDVLDSDGLELPDETAARIEAVRLAGLALHDDAPRVVERRRWTLDVTDGQGSLLYHVAVQATDRRIEPGGPAPL
ncbi:MAG: hypothetical protein INR70_10330 [Parafilimonas terrae]|nr:hypothetical protein [Parafilimonas terrae]